MTCSLKFAQPLTTTPIPTAEGAVPTGLTLIQSTTNPATIGMIIVGYPSQLLGLDTSGRTLSLPASLPAGVAPATTVQSALPTLDSLQVSAASQPPYRYGQALTLQATATARIGTLAQVEVEVTSSGGTSNTTLYTIPISAATPAGTGTANSATFPLTLQPPTVGTLTITARAVDSIGGRSPPRSLMLNIEQGTQQITGFTPPATLIYTPAPNNTLTLTATGSGVGSSGNNGSGNSGSGNPVTFTATTPAVCTTSGSTQGSNNTNPPTSTATLTIFTTGTCTITANQAGNANYLAAPEVTASISINKAAQVITGFTPPQTLNQAAGSTLTLTAAGGESNNPVTFSSTTPSICTTGGNNGATLTIVTAGTCTVTANQAGNDNYSAAAPQTVSISITPPVVNAPAQLYFIHPDHLGTPRVITKATDNTKVWEWKNDDPFGNNLPDENPNGVNGATPFQYNLRFPGQYFDVETGTYFNWNRDYDPATGRYVQSDPIGLRGGINTYRYALNNPLLYIDPTGLVELCTVLGTASGAWGSGTFENSMIMTAGWQLSLMHTSITQSGKVGGFRPGAKVDCYAKFVVSHLEQYKKSRNIQTLEQCISTCPPSLKFVTRNRTEDEFYTQTRVEIKDSVATHFSIAAAADILGQIKCLEWLKGLK
jgi:RHS repeat-associated protein